jgi:hypothetical protein
MRPVLSTTNGTSQHPVFLHYCGFRILAARVHGRFKVFWATQKWYTNDASNSSICRECCNGANPWSKPVTGVVATELCGCQDKDIIKLPDDAPIVYDMQEDLMELHPLDAGNWPPPAVTGNVTFAEVMVHKYAQKRTCLSHLYQLTIPAPRICAWNSTTTSHSLWSDHHSFSFF